MSSKEKIDMGLAEPRWDALLEKAGVLDPEQRGLVARALSMAQEKISATFAGRIDCAAVAYGSYSASEHRMPLLVWIPYLSDDEYCSLEEELTVEVLGPVLRETGITLPPFLIVRQAAKEPGIDPSGVGVLYPAA